MEKQGGMPMDDGITRTGTRVVRRIETYLECVAKRLAPVGYAPRIRELGDGRQELTLTDPDFKIRKKPRLAKAPKAKPNGGDQ